MQNITFFNRVLNVRQYQIFQGNIRQEDIYTFYSSLGVLRIRILYETCTIKILKIENYC